ncbi:MAG: hypothetical protein ABI231_09160 [Candidatus Tumulicola sp.]
MYAGESLLFASKERKIRLHYVQLAGPISDEYRHAPVDERGLLGERLVPVKPAAGDNNLMRLDAHAMALPANVGSECTVGENGYDCSRGIGCRPNHRLERARRFVGDLGREANGKEISKISAVDDAEIDPPLASMRDRVGGRFERLNTQSQCETVPGACRHDAQSIAAPGKEWHDGRLGAVSAADDDQANLLFDRASDGFADILALLG